MITVLLSTHSLTLYRPTNDI